MKLRDIFSFLTRVAIIILINIIINIVFYLGYAIFQNSFNDTSSRGHKACKGLASLVDRAKRQPGQFLLVILLLLAIIKAL